MALSYQVTATGAPKGKYAGQPCQVCGQIIPDRRPQGAVRGVQQIGPYCTEVCWAKRTR
jgi:hypothetical protein